MIKKGILLIFSLCSLVHASPIQDRKIESAALWELALELGIPPGANLIEETQKRWLRKPTQERWELNEISPKQRRNGDSKQDETTTHRRRASLGEMRLRSIVAHCLSDLLLLKHPNKRRTDQHAKHNRGDTGTKGSK